VSGSRRGSAERWCGLKGDGESKPVDSCRDRLRVAVGRHAASRVRNPASSSLAHSTEARARPSADPLYYHPATATNLGGTTTLKIRWLKLYTPCSEKTSTFGFPEVKWLHLTGEMDKSVRGSCQIFWGFNAPKSLKSVNFCRSYSQNIRVGQFFGTQCRTPSLEVAPGALAVIFIR